jgi:hypothetical protein
MIDERLDPPVRLLALYQQICSADMPDLVVAVPGRAIWAAVHFTGTTFFKVIDADGARHTRFDVRSSRHKRTLLRRPIPDWARYAAGVTALASVRFLPGAEILVCSDETSGPRRDHSLGMLITALWNEVNDLPTDEDTLFQMAERTRRDYIELA